MCAYTELARNRTVELLLSVLRGVLDNKVRRRYFLEVGLGERPC